MVATKTLVKAAVFGSLVTASAGLWVNNQIESRIKKSDYFVEALKTLRNHPGSLHLLGEPMKVGRVNLGDTAKNRCDASSSKFQVSVKGPKGKGTLFLEARRESVQDKWEITRLALRVDSIADKELLIRGGKASSTGN